MATSALAPDLTLGVARAPRPPMLWAIARDAPGRFKPPTRGVSPFSQPLSRLTAWPCPAWVEPRGAGPARPSGEPAPHLCVPPPPRTGSNSAIEASNLAGPEDGYKPRLGMCSWRARRPRATFALSMSVRGRTHRRRSASASSSKVPRALSAKPFVPTRADDAQPLEYPVRPGGFEPPTRGLEVRRSVH